MSEISASRTMESASRERAHRPAGVLSRALSAELASVTRRPGVRVATAVWAAQILLFGYVVQYLVYRSLGDTVDADQTSAMASVLAPDQLGITLTASIPAYGIPVGVVLGALLAAADYRWGVLRTILVRFPSRTALLAARWVTLVVAVALVMLAGLLAAVLGSAVVGIVEGGPLAWPSVGAVVGQYATGVLMMLGYAALGFLLGIVLRSTMAAAAVGIGWLVAVELLLVGGLAGVVPGLDIVQRGLLSPAVGSLASGLDGSGAASGSGIPGLSTAQSPLAAVVVLVAWVLVSVIVSTAVFRRRDV